jgi:hypothetical protein
MAAPIYKGGPPFFKPYIRFRNQMAFGMQIAGGGSPVSGTSGTYAGKAGPGSLFFDNTQTNGVFSWQNFGTLASPTWLPDAGSAIPGYLRVPVTSAQLLAMFTTPVSVLAAPAAGQAIVVQQIAFEMIATATAYTSGGTVNFVYHGGSVTPVTGTVAAAIVTATGPTTVVITLGPNIVSTGNAVTNAVGIDITNATGAFLTGTGTAVVHLFYSILTL